MGIILASSSPRRKELMALITPYYRVIKSEIDEQALRADTPIQLAQALAQAKCEAVAARYTQDTVIGCDTVVAQDGCVYGKPDDKAHARRMLQALSGRTHFVHTGVCICKAGQQSRFAVTTRVSFCPLSPQEIEAYIATREPYDKAGGYGIQGAAAKFVAGVEGCYFNVVGLPVSHVYQALRALGEAL